MTSIGAIEIHPVKSGPTPAGQRSFPNLHAQVNQDFLTTRLYEFGPRTEQSKQQNTIANSWQYYRIQELTAPARTLGVSRFGCMMLAAGRAASAVESAACGGRAGTNEKC